MTRFLSGSAALVMGALGITPVLAADLPAPGCVPAHARHHHYHRHVAVYPAPARVVINRMAPPIIPYNHEDNGQYDGADLPPPPPPVGQQASWLDGYGTRPANYGPYGTYNVYGGSAQVMPYGMPAIPPAGGLAVYSPGAYGPGPRIVQIPPPY